MLKQKLLAIFSALIFIGLLVVSFFIFSYLIAAAAVIAFTLFVISYVRAKWHQIKNPQKTTQENHPGGRTIEHDDN